MLKRRYISGFLIKSSAQAKVVTREHKVSG